MSVTLDAARRDAARKLAAACGLTAATAQIEARALARHALGCNDGQLLLRGTENLAESAAGNLKDLVELRAGGAPVAHLTGSREFYGINIACSPAALIPRPETEMLVDLALAYLDQLHRGPVADWGTGTGAIACALAANRPNLLIDAIDTDRSALSLAKANSAPWAGRIALRCESWKDAPAKRYCAILANPPYLTSEEARTLLTAGQLHDPVRALDGGSDGLDCVRTLGYAAFAALQPGGMLAIEHGASQQDAVAALLDRAGFAEVTRHCDLAGLPRAVSCLRP